MKSLQFDKSRRLRTRGEFERVFDTGQRLRGRFVTLLIARNQGSTSRLGVVASRKLGDAVRRNRAKRLIREVFRRSPVTPELGPLDIVVIPRPEMLDTAYPNLENDYRAVLARAARQVTPRVAKDGRS